MLKQQKPKHEQLAQQQKKNKLNSDEQNNGPTTTTKRTGKVNGPTVKTHDKQPKSKEIIENSSADEETKAVTKPPKKKSTVEQQSSAPVDEKVTKPVKKEDGNSPPDMFKQCKELLRPVKKWFSGLDAPEDAFDTHDEYNKALEKCLLKIGDQIETVLKNKSDDEYQTYRQHLWNFVSKFTTKLTDSQLRKTYRNLLKKRQEENSTSNPSMKSSHSMNSSYSQSNSKSRHSEQDDSYVKAGWGYSSQSNNNSNTRNMKDSRLKHSSTMPLSRSSRSEQSSNLIGSTNTGTTNDYDSHHHHYDRHRHYPSGNNNHRRSYHDSPNESSSDYRTHYHRDRDNNSSRGPRRYDSMPSRYDQSSYNNRQSYSSNFSRPPPPFDESRSSSNRPAAPNNNRSTQNSSMSDQLPPSAFPPSGLTGSELFQSMFSPLYNMCMQQTTGLSSSQPSKTNVISPNTYADMAAAYARQQMQPPAPQS